MSTQGGPGAQFAAVEERHLCGVGYQYHDWEIVSSLWDDALRLSATVLILKVCKRCNKAVRVESRIEDE